MIQRRGQTLLELVIAAGVISISVIAALTLILRTINLAQQSQQTVEAGNYAREGAEIVRMIRDSNWLAIDDNEQACGALVVWDSDGNRTTCSTLAGEYIASFTPGTGWSLERCSGTCSSAEQVLYRATAVPNYTTQSTGLLDPNAFRALPYRRVIKISKQSTSVAIPPSAAAPLPTVDYLDIEVEVSWTGLNPRTTSIREQLYQWR